MLIVGLIAFLAAVVCFMIWRSIQPELIGTVVLGAVDLAAVMFGFIQLANSYTTLDGATGGFLGKLLALFVALLPVLLVAGILWLLTKWADNI